MGKPRLPHGTLTIKAAKGSKYVVSRRRGKSGLPSGAKGRSSPKWQAR
jgi:hypothetical protein